MLQKHFLRFIPMMIVFNFISNVYSEVCLPPQNPFPFKTPFPININSKSAKVIKAKSALTFGLGTLNLLYIRNTGKAIESMPNEIIDKSFATGGILCNKTYAFYKTRFYINQNGSRSANAIDGIGFPFEIVIYFYNTKYKTFRNALNYRDGVVASSFGITIVDKHVPNLLYVPVQLVLTLQLLRKPGALLPVTSSLVYGWFDTIPLLYQYYVYPGSYTDLDTGKEYDSVTYILFHPNFAYMSKTQFEAFKNVLGNDGNPIQTTAPLKAVGPRPIYKVRGDVIQILLPL